MNLTPEQAAQYRALAAKLQAHEPLPDCELEGPLAVRAWVQALNRTTTEDYEEVDNEAAWILLDCVKRGQAL